VAALMLLMNSVVAKKLKKHGAGVFRSTRHIQQNNEQVVVPGELKGIVEGTTGFYSVLTKFDDGVVVPHSSIGVDAYLHVTSPIRRLVDLLNMIQLIKLYDLLPLSKEADAFYSNWIGNMDGINESMQNIRRVQNSCLLLHTVTSEPSSLNKQYLGYVIDRNLTGTTVFLPELKMTTYTKTTSFDELYSRAMYSLFVFEDEHKLKRKVRVQKE
jgi:exoribonuclease R